MLSAYGFYDGTARDANGRTTKGGWGGIVLQLCCSSALTLHACYPPSECTL